MVALSIGAAALLATFGMQCQFTKCLNTSVCLRLDPGFGANLSGREFCVCDTKFFGTYCQYDVRSQQVETSVEVAETDDAVSDGNRDGGRRIRTQNPYRNKRNSGTIEEDVRETAGKRI